MSTSTAMTDCFQPGQAKVMPGPTPLVFPQQQRVRTVQGYSSGRGGGTGGTGGTIQSKGVGPGPTLAWPGWKQPDISVKVDTAR